MYGLVTYGTSAKATIKDSAASGNTVAGLYAGEGELNAEGCLVANNDTGLESTVGTVRASNCTVTDNTTGLVVAIGSLLSRSNNTVEGNGTDGTFTGTYLAQ
jgi:hypothetical protein